MNHHGNTINRHPSEALLEQFSSRDVSVGLGTLVSAHLEYCSECADRYLAIQSKQVEQWSSSDEYTDDIRIQGMVAAIVNSPQTASAPDKASQSESPSSIEMCGYELSLPTPLDKLAQSDLVWKERAGGIRQARVMLDSDTQCDFLYMKPGSEIPPHRHQGSEITLILEGSFQDDEGQYRAGDFVHRQGSKVHNPISEEGCLCFAVLDKPLSFTTGLARLLNPVSGLLFNRS